MSNSSQSLYTFGPVPIKSELHLLNRFKQTTPQSCETSPDGLYLCPIRIGLGISKIKAIGARPVQEGSRVAWNNEGWCGLAHDVLEIDFGRVYDIKMIKVNGMDRSLEHWSYSKSKIPTQNKKKRRVY